MSDNNEEFVKQAKAIGLDMSFLTSFASALLEIRRAAGLGVGLSLNAKQTKALLKGLRLLQSGLKK